MNIHIDHHDARDFSLNINGDLQFDSRDEALYHESMALPALCLAKPDSEDGLRVLICGGGDGLALRECLRYPGVSHVDLVDYSPEVLNLAGGELSELNRHSLKDSRVTIHLMNSIEFLEQCSALYNVILCDFTVPRTQEDTAVYTREWYDLLKSVLHPDGAACVNGVSPRVTPAAFWSLRRTIRYTGLSALPYRVCIPSFRGQGYGEWAFFLVAHRALTQQNLRFLACPVTTRQADLTRLWRGSRFARNERMLEAHMPVHSIRNTVFLDLLLNPEMEIPSLVPIYTDDVLSPGYDLNSLLRRIPVQQSCHTREMIETLARHVVGSLRSFDLRQLLNSILKKAAGLPAELLQELKALSVYLNEHSPDLDRFRSWGYKVFAALVITMVIANTIAPDNAFAKGNAGLGHASISRGYAGGFGGGRGGAEAVSAGANAGSGHISGSGYRSGGWGLGRPTDIYGNTYSPRIFIFHSSYPTHSYTQASGARAGNINPQQNGQKEQHKVLFVADDDMLVLDNGDVVLTLSNDAYLLLSGGDLLLMSSNSIDPLLTMYPDPNLFKTIRTQINAQILSATQQSQMRRDWLDWVGWTSALFPIVQSDRNEMRNLNDLIVKLNLAQSRLQMPSPLAVSAVEPVGSVELFAGAYLLPDGNVALRTPKRWIYTAGKTIIDGKTIKPCPKEISSLLLGVMKKLQKEFDADLKEEQINIMDLQQENVSLKKDMNEYQSLAFSNGYSYEVDYGTSTVSASRAIELTTTDLLRNEADMITAVTEKKKTLEEQQRLGDVVGRWKL